MTEVEINLNENSLVSL